MSSASPALPGIIIKSMLIQQVILAHLEVP